LPCEFLPSLSPRLRGEGRREGRFFEFGQERLQNSVKIVDDFVVPDAEHAIAEGAEGTVALLVLGTFRVLTAIEFDNQATFTANEVAAVSINGLLADEFEAAELPTANASPQL
jgi:hypothetical protein